jgi:dipeptidyl aminopeptidase/acylaminoacyl peptidase
MKRLPSAAATMSLWAVLMLSGRADAQPALQDFIPEATVTSAKLSPGGEYVAFTRTLGDVESFQILRLADGSRSGGVVQKPGNGISDFAWVGADRLLLAPSEQTPEGSIPTGALIGINADGSKPTYLFGAQGEQGQTTGSLIRHVETRHFASARIIAVPDAVDGRATIAVDNWQTSLVQVLDRPAEIAIHAYTYLPDEGGAHPMCASMTSKHACSVEAFLDPLGPQLQSRAFSIHANDGSLGLPTFSPLPGYSQFMADSKAIVRFAMGRKDAGHWLLFARNAESEDWLQIDEDANEEQRDVPLSLSRDASSAYLKSRRQSDRSCLVEESLSDGSRKVLSCDPEADFDHLMISPDGHDPIAAVYTSGQPSARALPSTPADAAFLKALQASFPGEFVEPVSRSADGARLILSAYSDRSPERFYLLDRKTGEASLVFAPTVATAQMVASRPISMTARDGQTLHGYLSLPAGTPGTTWPLVVKVHDGPFGAADEWRWDAQTQLLASRGYAVLRVNYRGSGGYGAAFIDAGRSGWDSTVFNDVIDASQWASQQPGVDHSRICIYGAGMGAYIALASAEREPNLYRCVIGLGGVYDLKAYQSQSGALGGKFYAHSFVQELSGAAPERLHRASPLFNLDELQAAVLLVHAKDDLAVPVSQSQSLRDALAQRHDAFDWLEFEGEGHRLAKTENQLAFDQKLLDFLEANLRKTQVDVGPVKPSQPPGP